MISPTLLYRGTLGSSATTVATTTTNGQTTINSIVATNKTANARVFSITVGGVYFAYLMPISAYQTITLDIRQVANPGTAVQAWADATTAVDLSISCAIQTPTLYLGSGTGSPEGVLTASQGAEWVQTNDSQLTYLKWRKLTGSGNTGWYPDFEGRWKTWTPTIAAATGTYTTTSSTAYYTQSGKTIKLIIGISLTNVGTGTGACTFTLPATSRNIPPHLFASGRADSISGKMLQGKLSSTTVCAIFNYDNSTAYASGEYLNFGALYEVA
jgi:hypothetical protein